MGERRSIDFGRLNDALLQGVDTWLRRWLPNGVERNGRWYVGDFDGSPGESANVNMSTGQWIDNAAPDEDVGRDLISLYARVHNCANGEAARILMEELGWERPAEDERRFQPAAASGGVQAPAQGDEPLLPEPDGAAPAPDGATPAPAKPRGKRESKWRAVTPVPPHAPKPGFAWSYQDKTKPGKVWIELEPARTWEYRFEGELYGYVARFERVNSDGELVKDTLPRTWCVNIEDDRGHSRWHWKTWEAPRPLYVPATLLSADCALPVVVVEGEKCAEAGHQLLGHEFDFVSWPGGCKTWSYAHWAWLMGRTVYLWPDCDSQHERLTKAERDAGKAKDSKPLLPEHQQPGMQAMVHIGSLLAADHGCTVFMCQIPKPGKVSDGWDIADAIAEGMDADQVRAFIRSAVPFVPPSDEARAKVGAQTASKAGAGTGVDGGDGWRKGLVRGKDAIKAVRENVVLALDGMQLPSGQWLPGAPEARGVIAFNEFTNNVEMTRQPPWKGKAGVWGEETELEMGDWLTHHLWLPPMARSTLEEAVLMVGRRNAYHPVRQRFERLRGQWDGIKRLPSWLARCCVAPESMPEEPEARQALQRYLARVGTWFLMAIVRRILQPGCKFDYMLVLEGSQGRFKSTLASILACGHFADTGLVLGDKDSYQNLQGVLLYEWAELDALARADVRKVKSFISSTVDRFRASFDRRPRDYPRQCVFVGTTNESHYLSDPTGNRRFWPVKVTRQIDLDWVRENLDQMLAEAVHRVDAGERMWPTPEEQLQLFNPQQGERMVESSLDAAIREYLYDEDQKVGMTGVNGAFLSTVTLKGLLAAVGLPLDKQTPLIVKEASAVLARLGWERRTKQSVKVDAARPWLYYRPKEGPSDGAGASHATAEGDSGPQGRDTEEAADGCPFP